MSQSNRVPQIATVISPFEMLLYGCPYCGCLDSYWSASDPIETICETCNGVYICLHFSRVVETVLGVAPSRDTDFKPYHPYRLFLRRDPDWFSVLRDCVFMPGRMYFDMDFLQAVIKAGTKRQLLPSQIPEPESPYESAPVGRAQGTIFSRNDMRALSRNLSQRLAVRFR